MYTIKKAKVIRKTLVQGVSILLFNFLMRLEYVSLHWRGGGRRLISILILSIALGIKISYI
jgi:hypothetical protein